MSSPIPPGWTDNATYLDDYVTVHGPNSDAEIVFTEVMDKVSHSTQRWSSGQSSAAEMIFATTWDNLNDSNTAATIAESILGGYSETDDAMYAPMAHPQVSMLYATDIEVQPLYVDNTQDGDPPFEAAYRYALLKISFQSLPYLVTGSNAWREWRQHACNDRITTPVGYYIFTSGVDNGQTAFLGQVYTSGTSYQELIAHRVDENYAIQNDGNGLSVLAPYCGQINSDTSGPFSATGNWLFDSVTCDVWGTLTGGKTYDVHLHLIYHPNGWNKSLDSSGTFSPIAAHNGTSPPYQSTSFTDLIAALYPS